MRVSVYERLERDRAAARRAQLAAERREREIASIRCALASIDLDLALVKLQRRSRASIAPTIRASRQASLTLDSGQAGITQSPSM